MSWLDTIGSKIMPLASDEDRAEARREAERIALNHEWLAMIISHHSRIMQLVDEALIAADPDARRRTLKELARLTAGHSIAEEMTVYPAIVDHTGPISGKIHAAMAYEEQQVTKIQFAKLEQLDPMSHEWENKLNHTRKALQQHIYQEESNWYPEMARELTLEESARLSRRYAEESERYCGSAPEGTVQRR